jgi:hypothetical protein
VASQIALCLEKIDELHGAGIYSWGRHLQVKFENGLMSAVRSVGFERLTRGRGV